MADPIYLVQGDDNSQIKVTLTRKATGDAVDITGGTVRLKVFERFSTTNSFILTGTNTAATSGVVVFDFQGGELDALAEGIYKGELEFTNDSGLVESVYDYVDIIVREDR